MATEGELPISGVAFVTLIKAPTRLCSLEDFSRLIILTSMLENLVL